MAKRTRRKKNERKDFQKVKFKVGKQKPKGLNATDTSFKSKGIALQTQFQISSAAQTSTRGLGVKVSADVVILVTLGNRRRC